MSQYMARLRQMLVNENSRYGSVDVEVYPLVVVTLGTFGWGALMALRKLRDTFPAPNLSAVETSRRPED